jgi:hypothetical protein
MTKVTIKEKWINAAQATFREELTSDNKKKFVIEALIVPFNKISRNGVLYSKESIERTYKNLETKYLHHNHEINGANNFPRGRWVEAYLDNDGLRAKAEVYDTAYNKDYLEWLHSDKSPQVSLQITGEAESVKGEDGKYFQRAEINDWLEVSTVNVPGFLQAKGSFESVMCEMLKNVSFKEIIRDKNGKPISGGAKVKTPEGKMGYVYQFMDDDVRVTSKPQTGLIGWYKGNELEVKESLSEDNDMANSGELTTTKMIKKEDEDELQIGDKVKSRNGNGVLVAITGNQGTIQTDETEITANLDDIWRDVEDNFFEKLNEIRFLNKKYI